MEHNVFLDNTHNANQMLSAFPVLLAGLHMRLLLHYEEAGRYFDGWRDSLTVEPEFDFQVSKADIEHELTRFPADVHPGNAELSAIVYRLSNVLLRYNRIFFHGLAFHWRGRAWIVTGPSGIGKTTQWRNWRKLFGEEATLICGDRPVLESKGENRMVVHSSPWNGKENFRSKMQTAELGGIVFLKQTSDNEMHRIEAKEAILALYRQFMVVPKDGQTLKQIGEMLEKIIFNVPIWKLCNCGDVASTELACRRLGEYLEHLHDNDVLNADKADGSASGAVPTTTAEQGPLPPEDNPSDATYRINPEFQLLKICGKGVVVQIKDVVGTLPRPFLLNASAEVYWRLLEKGCNRDRMLNAMQALCAVPRETLSRDLEMLLKSFEANGMIISDRR